MDKQETKRRREEDLPPFNDHLRPGDRVEIHSDCHPVVGCRCGTVKATDSEKHLVTVEVDNGLTGTWHNRWWVRGLSDEEVKAELEALAAM